MKLPKKSVLHKIILLLLLFATCLTATSCVFDPDGAVNIQDYITDEVEVKKDSTVFYFYYESAEHPIEDYGLIFLEIDYYVDYKTSMKKKDFLITVPDDIQYGETPYFTAEIPHALTEESHVYVTARANYKAEDKKTENIQIGKFVLSIVIALLMLIFLWAFYYSVCESCYSNSAPASAVWLLCIGLYVLISIIITKYLGTGPGSIILSSAALYFFCTLITFFTHKA